MSYKSFGNGDGCPSSLKAQMSYPIKDELITGTLDLSTLGMRRGTSFYLLMVALLRWTERERDSQSLVNVLGDRECSLVQDGAKDRHIGGT
jgi:hypothetical protein